MVHGRYLRLRNAQEGHRTKTNTGQDGTRIAIGDVTGRLTIVDFTTEAVNADSESKIHPQSPYPAPAHAQGCAIKALRWFNVNNNEFLASGSWDKKVKYFKMDRGQLPAEAGEVQCQERVYSMDVRKSGNKHLLVIATAERHIHMVDLNNPGTIFKTITSPLKWQTRVVSCFADASGFAVGSIEGRCAIQYVDDKDTS